MSTRPAYLSSSVAATSGSWHNYEWFCGSKDHWGGKRGIKALTLPHHSRDCLMLLTWSHRHREGKYWDYQLHGAEYAEAYDIADRGWGALPLANLGGRRRWRQREPGKSQEAKTNEPEFPLLKYRPTLPSPTYLRYQQTTSTFRSDGWTISLYIFPEAL